MTGLDQAQLNFNTDALVALNALLALILFGVGLDLRVADIRRLGRRWPVLLTGLAAQWVLLPALTAGLVLVLRPSPSLALGMIIIAACPGGSVSNFFSQLARGDIALSVSLSAVSSALCFALTPFNIAFWGALVPDTRALLETVAIDWAQMLVLVVCVLLVPVLLGAAVVARAPRIAARLRRPMRRGSMGVFSVFVLAALFANGRLFLEWIGDISGLVAVHNSAALLLGYGAATAMRCATPERRAISIEVGIQNTALGLTLIFTFFDGLGGAALITAWWGVWHLLSGATLGMFWSRRPGATIAARSG